jgi:hypothetical protein
MLRVPEDVNSMSALQNCVLSNPTVSRRHQDLFGVLGKPRFDRNRDALTLPTKSGPRTSGASTHSVPRMSGQCTIALLRPPLRGVGQKLSQRRLRSWPQQLQMSQGQKR